MKIKAITREDAPQAFIEFLNGDVITSWIFFDVLMKYLHVDEDAGPAEHYMQDTDFARSCTGDNRHFCEVRLTGVSVNIKRSGQDFRDALEALTQIFASAITKHFPEGEEVQLMVSIMADMPIPYTDPPTNLIENIKWVKGDAKPTNE